MTVMERPRLLTWPFATAVAPSAGSSGDWQQMDAGSQQGKQQGKLQSPQRDQSFGFGVG
jgi:hypothetical protein